MRPRSARPGTDLRAPAAGRLGEWLYRSALAAARLVERAPRQVRGAAVVSIGNLEVGGAGKTPCTLWWAGALAARGVPAAVVCRPWGPPAGAHAGDEAALLAERLPASVRLYAGRSKAAEACRAARDGARVVVVDDGFSHRALARDLDLLLLDTRRPFGNGRCLPAGPLREPPAAVARAHAVVLSRADRAGIDDRRHARELVRAAGFAGPLLYARHRVTGLAGPDGVRPPAGETVYCVSGLARAGELAEAATAAGLAVAGARAFPDHHAFRAGEWRDAVAAARARGARLLLSAKDAVRLPPAARAEVHVLEVEWEWLDGEIDPQELVERACRAGQPA